MSGLRPVTIKQLLSATFDRSGHERCLIEGQTTSEVAVVARMLTVREPDGASSIQLHVSFEDGTGCINGIYWRNTILQQQISDAKQEGYLRVIGTLRETEGERSLKITSLQTLESCYEIFLHSLDVVRATLECRHEAQGPSKSGNKDKALLHDIRPHTPPFVSQERSEQTAPGLDTDTRVDTTFDENDGDSSDLNTDALSSDSDTDSYRSIGQHNGNSPEPIPTPSPQLPAMASPLPRLTSPRRISKGAFPKVDPLSHLSSLERAVLLHIWNNESYYQGGIPVTLVTRSISNIHEDTVRTLVSELVAKDYIAYTEDGRGVQHVA